MKREPKSKLKPLYETEKLKRNLKAPVRTLQNIHTTRVIVNAPSGIRYEFEPGQRRIVNDTDAVYLLSLEHGQAESGCCGGQAGSAKYFTEV
jgi:hypothetical protein